MHGSLHEVQPVTRSFKAATMPRRRRLPLGMIAVVGLVLAAAIVWAAGGAPEAPAQTPAALPEPPPDWVDIPRPIELFDLSAPDFTRLATGLRGTAASYRRRPARHFDLWQVERRRAVLPPRSLSGRKGRRRRKHRSSWTWSGSAATSGVVDHPQSQSRGTRHAVRPFRSGRSRSCCRHRRADPCLGFRGARTRGQFPPQRLCLRYRGQADVAAGIDLPHRPAGFEFSRRRQFGLSRVISRTPNCAATRLAPARRSRRPGSCQLDRRR